MVISKFKKVISGALIFILMLSMFTINVGAEGFKKGDVNKDGYITITDATEIQLILAGMKSVDKEDSSFLYVADVDSNGSVNIGDVTEIQKYLAGFSSSDIGKEEEINPTQDITKPETSSTEGTTSQEVIEPVEPTSTIVVETTEPTTEVITEPTTVVYPAYIKLNKSSLNLGKGEKYTLVVDSDIPDYTFSFSSSNESVVSVSNNGTIKAINKGTAVVTCSSENGLKAVCNVTVGEMADTVTLNATSLTLGIGETFDLDSYVPKGTAAYFRNYYSDNSDVAPVKIGGGIVTAKSVGSAVITCKLYNGVQATCKVTVKSAPSSVTISSSETKYKVGSTYYLSYSFNKESYANGVSISNSNNEVARVSLDSNKIKVQPYMLGTSTVTLKTYNGITASYKITVSDSNVKCIDVSVWQGENIDFKKVKASGIDYVIIRSGYGRETYQKDSCFESNYKKAKEAGLKIGTYWFSYAMSPEEAIKEANACLYCIKGKSFDLPVYFDVEYQPALNLGKTTLTNMVLNFCKTIEKNGYQAGVYSSASVYWNTLDRNTIAKDYSIWNAEWSSSCSVGCDVWQYSSTGSVSGISGNVDMNKIYNLNIRG